MARGRHGRGPLALVLVLLAASSLLGSLVTGYAADAIFDSDEFAERATAALDDEAVRDELARRITDRVVLRAQADLVAVRPVIEEVVRDVLGSGAFQAVFRQGVADLHRTFFLRDKDTVTMTIADIGTTVRGALQALRPQLAREVPGGTDADVTELSLPGWTATVARIAHDIPQISLGLLALGLLAAFAAVRISPDSRQAVLHLGVSIAIVGAVAAVLLGVAKAVVLDRIDQQGARDAADAIWNAFLGDLRTALLLFAGAGAVAAAAASSLLRPVDLAAPLRRAWELVTTVPGDRRWRAVRAALLIVLGVTLVVRRDVVLDLVLILAGVYVAYAGVSELMRLSIPQASEEERVARMRMGGRALLSAGVACGVIALAAAAFVVTGGTDESAASIDTVGCNGRLALCDRRVDEVTFPATHNAMSAVTNPDWLFGQQDQGFPKQLEDGIRGLLIDAHYGEPTESGAVKTDLSELKGGERATYARELGPQALDAALRIRDRIVDSPVTGDRAVYLCHRFCELGAIPIDRAFREYRDFLAANPSEVLVVDIEDYVKPRDIAAAVDSSGLREYVYDGPVGPPWPTLQEIIDSGGRVLMLAEHNAGSGRIPWYHEAYESLMQETPYSFKTPQDLIGRRHLTASCEPNRGPADARLFLINHWVDTSPAPKPSNAEQVNARRPLLRRVRHCEHQRDLTANLVAVDFYREGDLFGVVRRLNR